MASRNEGVDMTSRVEDYMNTKMVTLSSRVSVLDAAKAMTERNISSMVITSQDDGSIVGILTERDIVKIIANGAPADGIIASSLMSSPVLSITKDAMVEEAARLMIRQRVRHLLVVNSRQEVVGIITATDLARYLKQKLASTIISANVGDEESSLAEVWELFF